MPLFGVNILPQPNLDRAKAGEFLLRLRPRVIVVCDDIEFARYLKMMLPLTDVVFRRVEQQDASYYTGMSPEAWLAQFSSDAAGGLTLYCHNEPDSYGGDMRFLSKWLAALIRTADARGIKVCVGNFGVGHPDERKVNAGEFDELLIALAKSRLAVLGTHEYFEDDPVQESRWKIGRYRFLFDRAHALGLAHPRLYVTEYGRDVRGAMGANGDGWRNTGWSDAGYLTRLKLGMKLHYEQHLIPVCIFSLGSGYGWQTFDIAHAEDLQEALIQENARMNSQTQITAVPKPNVPGVKATVTVIPGDRVNVRAAPSTSGAVVGGLAIRASVTMYPAAIQNGWIYVEQTDGASGWVSLQNGNVVIKELETPTLPPVPPPPPVEPPKPSGAVCFTVEELSAIGTSVNLIMNELQFAGASIDALHTEFANIRKTLAEAAKRGEKLNA